MTMAGPAVLDEDNAPAGGILGAARSYPASEAGRAGRSVV